MRDADPLGDRARIVNIATGAASALAVGGGAVVVELERDADHVVAGFGQERGGDRRVDPTRHGDDNARVGRLTLDIETVQHGHAAVILPGSRSRGTCAIGQLDLALV